MKKYLLVFIGFVFFNIQLLAQPWPFSYPDQGCQNGVGVINSMPVAACNIDPYVLVYEEHFPSTVLDFNHWVPAQWVPGDINFKIGKQWYLPGNIQVNNGLQLVNKVENPPIDSNSYYCNAPNYPHYPNYCDYENAGITFKYSSASITSTFKYGYGIYEIYCNVPSGYLPYSSFWLYGGNTQHSNEIDVFEEQRGANGILKMNVHYDNNYCGFNYSCADLASGFHRVTLIYDPFFIYWLVDGSYTRQYYKYFGVDLGIGWYMLCTSPENSQTYLDNTVFPNLPMNVILSSAVASDYVSPFGNNPPDDPNNPTTFPNSFSIDSVHYYMQMPCGFDSNIFHETVSLGLTDWAEDKFIGGQNVKFDGTIEIQCVHPYESYDHPHSGYNLDVIAANSVDIKPGFSVDAGANFDARIDPNFCNYVYPYGNIEHRNSNPYDTLKKSPINVNSSNSLTNYPNPCQNSTTISFSLKDSGNVTITVYDVMGTKISTLLVERHYNKGNYSIPFDTQNLTSGIYYYNLKSSTYEETKKMVIVKL